MLTGRPAPLFPPAYRQFFIKMDRSPGDAVSHACNNRFPFTSGKIHRVEFDVGKDSYVYLERDLRNKLKRD